MNPVAAVSSFFEGDGQCFGQHIHIVIIKGCIVTSQSIRNLFCKYHSSGNNFKLSAWSATVLSLELISIDTLFPLPPYEIILTGIVLSASNISGAEPTLSGLKSP